MHHRPWFNGEGAALCHTEDTQTDFQVSSREENTFLLVQPEVTLPVTRV